MTKPDWWLAGCADQQEYDERREFEAASRDCKVQGHNWEHFYGGSVCRNCDIPG